jgi:hypothetical protein
LLLSKDLDAGRDQEFHKNDRRSHTSALGELFIADEWGRVQEKVCEIGSRQGRGELLKAGAVVASL